MGEEDTISDAVSYFCGEKGRQSTRTTGTGCHHSTLEMRGIAVPSAMARDPQGGKDVVKVAKAAICKPSSEDDTPLAGAAKGEEKKNVGPTRERSGWSCVVSNRFIQIPPPSPVSITPRGDWAVITQSLGLEMSRPSHRISSLAFVLHQFPSLKAQESPPVATSWRGAARLGIEPTLEKPLSNPPSGTLFSTSLLLTSHAGPSPAPLAPPAPA
jgi:hypothetical protein